MLSRFTEIVLLPQRHNAIYQRLGFVWGSLECRTYLLHLITDSKTKEGNDRQGFDPAVASELAKLLHHHDEEYPEFDSRDLGIMTAFTAQPIAGGPKPRPLPDPPPKGGWLVLVITAVVILGTLYTVFTASHP